MSSRCLLLVLLGLACLQSFTMAEHVNGLTECCFSYQTHPIPVKRITAYKETEHRCTKPGVIFTLKSGRQLCADPSVEWVQKHMKTVDQR
ncbi:C-C motif chemokine 3-like [Ictalurus furcatus]|uniref:C-C motif chemokine 3-like n=1 Tax=Ictalurus furcatus TaxID=66913 RepID=UPI0023506888|nr:C-C motif chemokine 3-like [Ictalurus furcatus]